MGLGRRVQKGDAMIFAPLYMAYLIYKGPWR
ncbi:hypothetical protein PMI37_00139 [Pseudomonas sp. GM80]|jgi:hypothetical protein|nr:hypothetical protein PMI37_00139 [Pseudomonas sp. GM80]